LRRGCRGDEKKGNCEQKSGHLECLHAHQRTRSKMVPQDGLEPPTVITKRGVRHVREAHAKTF
jgi:hypothetical protein